MYWIFGEHVTSLFSQPAQHQDKLVVSWIAKIYLTITNEIVFDKETNGLRSRQTDMQPENKGILASSAQDVTNNADGQPV